ncbi:MAG: hypothetical protein AAB209_06560 [Bacteroidota bacterium]
MNEQRARLIASLVVFLCCFGLLVHHLTAISRIDASRDAMMFDASADSSRHIHIRTDFAAFYYACKAVTRGGNMYDAKYLNSLAAADGVANHVLPYLYTPFFAIAAQPFGSLTPQLAQRVWDVLGA